MTHMVLMEKSMKGAFRSIGVNRNDFLSVIEMRPEQADITENTGNIIQWVAFASNVFNVLVPFYGEVETTPEYVSNTTGEVSTDNFYWASRMIAAMADASYLSNCSLPCIEFHIFKSKKYNRILSLMRLVFFTALPDCFILKISGGVIL